MPAIIVNGASGDDVEIALVSNDPRQATYNQGQIQSALSNGGYIQVMDPGTYYVTSDAFSYPADTQVFLATGVYFAIGNNVVTLNSLAPITTQPSSIAFVTTWAARPSAATYTARTLFVMDVGIGGSYWFSDGVKWRPVGGRVTLKNLTTEVSNSGAPKIVMDFATIPAGLVSDGDLIRIEYTKQRLGGTADTDATDIMVGTAPTTLGTSTGLITSALATTTVEIDVRAAYRKVSSTSVRPTSLLGAVGFGGATSASVAATVPNMDTQTTYIQITSDLTTAGGEVAWLRAYTVELISGS
jgi:hypothetical protein